MEAVIEAIKQELKGDLVAIGRRQMQNLVLRLCVKHKASLPPSFIEEVIEETERFSESRGSDGQAA